MDTDYNLVTMSCNLNSKKLKREEKEEIKARRYSGIVGSWEILTTHGYWKWWDMEQHITATEEILQTQFDESQKTRNKNDKNMITKSRNYKKMKKTYF